MYLRNGWYCAGWTSELDQAPIGRRMLDEPVVVYRSESGQPVALELEEVRQIFGHLAAASSAPRHPAAAPARALPLRNWSRHPASA